MLSKQQRLKKEQVGLVLKIGSSTHSPVLSVKTICPKESQKDLPRFSVVVSTKVAKLAVKRNLIKRRIRYIIKKHSEKLNNGCFVVLFAKKGSEKLTYAELEKEVLFVLKKATILNINI